MNPIDLGANLSPDLQDDLVTLSELELGTVGGGMGDVSFG